jgi:hypothetical protein
MKLVLSVSAIGEQAEGRCPWMWIDLSPPLAQKALERIDFFRFAEEKDDDVIELYYVSLEATFFNPWLAAPETKQEEEGSPSRIFSNSFARTIGIGRRFPMNSPSLSGPRCA